MPLMAAAAGPAEKRAPGGGLRSCSSIVACRRTASQQSRILLTFGVQSESIPALKIVINHEANLKIDGKKVPDDWLTGMRAAAAGRSAHERRPTPRSTRSSMRTSLRKVRRQRKSSFAVTRWSPTGRLTRPVTLFGLVTRMQRQKTVGRPPSAPSASGLNVLDLSLKCFRGIASAL